MTKQCTACSNAMTFGTSLARLCEAWLANAHKFADHTEGCACGSCLFARRFLKNKCCKGKPDKVKRKRQKKQSGSKG